ncbi:hypothetical protein B9Z19DRAFT_1084000 [Tuber borchii]|uniref:Uncharacterized protein n=1 Tax=Tuber borchii TaxID=42251 RepID=A0A2T6ZSJ3_TUBBO|nr:hypothetical protein B9Z19DRAFT_1084000 [Tuber borchii]
MCVTIRYSFLSLALSLSLSIANLGIILFLVLYCTLLCQLKPHPQSSIHVPYRYCTVPIVIGNDNLPFLSIYCIIRAGRIVVVVVGVYSYIMCLVFLLLGAFTGHGCI